MGTARCDNVERLTGVWGHAVGEGVCVCVCVCV